MSEKLLRELGEVPRLLSRGLQRGRFVREVCCLKMGLAPGWLMSRYLESREEACYSKQRYFEREYGFAAFVICLVYLATT